MMFRSKMDRAFKKMMTIILFIVTILMWLPPMLDESLSSSGWVYLSVLYVLIVGFFFWIFLDTKYEFKEHYLLVTGGPIRSKIKYADITKVAKTTDFYTGYRLATAKKGLEIFYTTGVVGSVKISPYQQDDFIEELVKRCPRIENKVT